STFYPAEAYHQDYAILHPDQPYVVKVDMPMLVNLKALFPEYYLEEPVLVYPSSKTASR
nr:peptide-methionine (S)-S-oxide reductase [Lautropia sp.]